MSHRTSFYTTFRRFLSKRIKKSKISILYVVSFLLILCFGLLFSIQSDGIPFIPPQRIYSEDPECKLLKGLEIASLDSMITVITQSNSKLQSSLINSWRLLRLHNNGSFFAENLRPEENSGIFYPDNSMKRICTFFELNQEGPYNITIYCLRKKIANLSIENNVVNLTKRHRSLILQNHSMHNVCINSKRVLFFTFENSCANSSIFVENGVLFKKETLTQFMILNPNYSTIESGVVLDAYSKNPIDLLVNCYLFATFLSTVKGNVFLNIHGNDKNNQGIVESILGYPVTLVSNEHGFCFNHSIMEYIRKPASYYSFNDLDVVYQKIALNTSLKHSYVSNRVYDEFANVTDILPNSKPIMLSSLPKESIIRKISKASLFLCFSSDEEVGWAFWANKDAPIYIFSKNGTTTISESILRTHQRKVYSFSNFLDMKKHLVRYQS